MGCGGLYYNPYCPACMLGPAGMGSWISSAASKVSKALKKVKKAVKKAASPVQEAVGGAVSGAAAAVKKAAESDFGRVVEVGATGGAALAFSKVRSGAGSWLKKEEKPLLAVGSVIGGGVLMATGFGAPIGLAVMGAGIGASLGPTTGFGKPQAWLERAGIGAAIGGAAGFAASAAAPSVFGGPGGTVFGGSAAAEGATGEAAAATGEGAGIVSPGSVAPEAVSEAAAESGISTSTVAEGAAATGAVGETPGWATASGLFDSVGKLTELGKALVSQAPQAMPMTAQMVQQGVPPDAAASMAYDAAAASPMMSSGEASVAATKMADAFKAAGGQINEDLAELYKNHKTAVLVAGSVVAAGLVGLVYLLMQPPKRSA